MRRMLRGWGSFMGGFTTAPRAGFRSRFAVALVGTVVMATVAMPLANAAPPPITSTAVVLTPTPNPVEPGGDVFLKAESPVAKTDVSSSEIVQVIDPTKMQMDGIDDIVAPDGWTISYSTNYANNGAAPTTWTVMPAEGVGVPWSTIKAIKAAGAVKSNGATPEGDQVSAASATGKPTSELPATVDTSGAGDGYQAFFDPAHTMMFNVPHHQIPTAAKIDCHLISTGARCTGFTKLLGISSSDTSMGRVVGTKLWTVGTRVQPGQANVKVGQLAFKCIDISAVAAGGSPTDCATATGSGLVPVESNINGTLLTPNMDFSAIPAGATTVPYNNVMGPGGAGFEGAADETRLFAYSVLTGKLVCVDTATMAACPGSPYSLFSPTANITAYNVANQSGIGDTSVQTWDGRVYVKALVKGAGTAPAASSFAMTCVIEADPTQKCPGFGPSPLTVADGISWGKFVELPTAAGGTAGMCLLGTTVKCFDKDGVVFAGPPTLVNNNYTSSNLIAPWGYTVGQAWLSQPVRLGTKVYFSDADAGYLNKGVSPYFDQTWTPDGTKLACWDAVRAATASTVDAAGCMGPALVQKAAWTYPQSNPTDIYGN